MAGRSRRVTVVLACNHSGLRAVVSTLLSGHFHLAAAVPSGDDLLRAATELRPDVIISDDDLLFRDGTGVLAALRAAGIETPLVLIGINATGAARFLKSGATAFVHKFDIHDELRAAVLCAVYGEQFISRSSLQSLD